MEDLTLRRIGDGLGVELPREVLDRLGLKEGGRLHLAEEGGRLVLTTRDPDVEDTMAAFDVIAEKYRNTFEELSK